MEELMKKQNLIFIGVGLVTAVVIYNVLINREKASKITQPVTKSLDDNSSFCGCGA
jgi:hypothetical protein